LSGRVRLFAVVARCLVLPVGVRALLVLVLVIIAGPATRSPLGDIDHLPTPARGLGTAAVLHAWCGVGGVACAAVASIGTGLHRRRGLGSAGHRRHLVGGATDGIRPSAGVPAALDGVGGLLGAEGEQPEQRQWGEERHEENGEPDDHRGQALTTTGDADAQGQRQGHHRLHGDGSHHPMRRFPIPAAGVAREQPGGGNGDHRQQQVDRGRAHDVLEREAETDGNHPEQRHQRQRAALHRVGGGVREPGVGEGLIKIG